MNWMAAPMTTSLLPRVQLALNVDDLDAAVDFYSRLLGVPAAKRRPGYANFAVAEPPLKLVLLENPGQGGTLNHLGVEVGSTAEVAGATRRLAEQGLPTELEDGVTCCHATAGQGVGHRARRRALGGLHRPRRHPRGHHARRPAGARPADGDGVGVDRLDLLRLSRPLSRTARAGPAPTRPAARRPAPAARPDRPAPRPPHQRPRARRGRPARPSPPVCGPARRRHRS